MTTRFSADDLALFAAATHDRNPLHLSPGYARKTPFGQQVVYGILGVLACWPALRIPRGQGLAMLAIELSRPIFLDVEYHIVAGGNSVQLLDGSTQILKLQVEFSSREEVSPELSNPALPPRTDADSPDDSVLTPGFFKQGEYRPDPESTSALLRRFGIQDQTLSLIALLWSSYFTGMEIPGERALYFKLSLRFRDPISARGVFAWEARLLSKNPLNQLRSEVRISIDGQPAANGHIEAFVRPKPVLPADILLRSHNLAGKTALVIGASRGLGAAITRALALQGADVLANFQHSRPEAEQLAQSLADAPGKVFLHQGDAASLDWTRSLVTPHGKLDFLVLNACPSVSRMWVEPAGVERINTYVAHGFALVSTPLAVFAGSVQSWTVLISSIYVETAPKEFPQYVALKGAVEGLFRTAARQYRQSGYLLIRPPKLLTDMTNTPYGTRDAIAPEKIALELVDRLRDEPKKPGQIEMLNGGGV
jgi:NAD(P)-dependent dehydrogenase (short-subunit alcohol dehydrogenase family)